MITRLGEEPVGAGAGLGSLGSRGRGRGGKGVRGLSQQLERRLSRLHRSGQRVAGG